MLFVGAAHDPAQQFVENVPEQPKDTLILQQVGEKWDVWDTRPRTRKHAEAVVKGWGCRFLLVTVPVQS